MFCRRSMGLTVSGHGEMRREGCCCLFALISLSYNHLLLATMAYNREWDRGKDNWDDPHSWNEYQGRGQVRGRDEDYYAEGKRRKFNNGVRNSLSFMSSLLLILVYAFFLRVTTHLIPMKNNPIIHNRVIIVKIGIKRRLTTNTNGETLTRNDSFPANPVPMSSSLD